MFDILFILPNEADYEWLHGAKTITIQRKGFADKIKVFIWTRITNTSSLISYFWNIKYINILYFHRLQVTMPKILILSAKKQYLLPIK